jgi:hypothetical protein
MTEEVGMTVYPYKRTGLIDIPRWGDHIIGYSYGRMLKKKTRKKRVLCMDSVWDMKVCLIQCSYITTDYLFW